MSQNSKSQLPNRLRFLRGGDRPPQVGLEGERLVGDEEERARASTEEALAERCRGHRRRRLRLAADGRPGVGGGRIALGGGDIRRMQRGGGAAPRRAAARRRPRAARRTRSADADWKQAFEGRQGRRRRGGSSGGGCRRPAHEGQLQEKLEKDLQEYLDNPNEGLVTNLQTHLPKAPPVGKATTVRHDVRLDGDSEVFNARSDEPRARWRHLQAAGERTVPARQLKRAFELALEFSPG